MYAQARSADVVDLHDTRAHSHESADLLSLVERSSP